MTELFCGDFNMHIDVPCNTPANDFISITNSLNFQQHVSGPTHHHGHTLDLVFTLGLNLLSLEVKDLPVSDHKLIMFFCDMLTANTVKPQPKYTRILNQHSTAKLCTQFNSTNNSIPIDCDTNNLVNLFNSSCSSTLDFIAPLKARRNTKSDQQPWLNDT